MSEKSEMIVLAGDDFVNLQAQYNKDTNTLVKAHQLLIHAENENSELRKQVAKLEADNLILKGFCETNLCMMESIDDDDENALSYEDKANYITQAKHFLLRFNRIHNRINVMQEYNDNY